LAHLNNSQGLAAFSLPTPVTQPASAVVVDKIAKYDATMQAAMRDERVLQLNPKQRAVYDSVMAVVDHRAFFDNGLSGIGKTFIYSCLLNTVRT
jgi:phosphate starvation-inducible protein PhoH